MHVRMNACMYVCHGIYFCNARVRVRLGACLYTRMCACVNESMYCMRVYMHTMHVCMWAHLFAGMYGCTHACMHLCMPCLCIHACLDVCMSVCICAHMHACMHDSCINLMHALMHACMDGYMDICNVCMRPCM